jgi:hypothetical protein
MQDLNEIYYIYKKGKLFYASKEIGMEHGNSYVMCWSKSEALAEVLRRNTPQGLPTYPKKPLPPKARLKKKGKSHA